MSYNTELLISLDIAFDKLGYNRETELYRPIYNVNSLLRCMKYSLHLEYAICILNL